MKLPLEITFRNVTRTDEIEDRIRFKAAKLDKLFDRLIGCRVVIESPHQHHHKGNTFAVRIELSVPGGELVVTRDSRAHGHEDMGLALRDAFSAAQRQLQSFAEKHSLATNRETIRIAEALSA